MDDLNAMLSELAPVREGSGDEVRQALLSAMWRRSSTQLERLAAQFFTSRLFNLARMCRLIADAKARQ